MRKKRAIIYDDDIVILNVMSMFFELRDYEVIACREPVPCPVYIERGRCTNAAPCGDIILTDDQLPRMSGSQLLDAQMRSGCKLTSKNKAIMSAVFDSRSLAAVKRLGCRYFRKPVEFVDLEHWVAECEQRIDFSVTLGFRRREERSDCLHDVLLRGETAKKDAEGTIVNQSPSGLCVSVDCLPSLYEVVTLQTDVPLTTRSAMVRWARGTGDGKYLVGLSSCRSADQEEPDH